MADLVAKDYVVVVIDTDRMTNGKEVAAELRKTERGGIPWITILDGDGDQKTTSDGPRGNCGCPAQPHEIDHFMTMVDATRQHMTAADRTIVERELRAYGAGLVRPRRMLPGYATFATATRHVRYGDFAAAVRALNEAYAAGYPAHELVTDPSLRPLREDPDRRLELIELLRTHAKADAIGLVDRTEPGRRIRLAGRVVDFDSGEPLAGALMQLFHTDADGEYRPGMDAGGGAGNPRLFGFLRTDGEGRFTVDTIMPERYPNAGVPRHVHYRVWADGYADFDSECFFDADPLLDDRTRQNAPKRNFPIVVLTTDDEQRQVGELVVRVPKGE